jgi:hypothetical protein
MRKEDRKPAAWGVFSLLATILGVIVPMRYPTFAPELLTMVFWGGIVGMGGCFIWLLYEHLNEAWQNWWRERRMTPLIGIIACSIGLAVFLALFLRQQNQSPSDIRLAEIEAKTDSIRYDFNKFVMPRGLSADQSKRLVEYLLPREHYLIYIVYSDEDQEAKEYAQQFWQALKEASWDPRMTPADVGGKTPTRMAFSPGVRINYTIAKEPFDGSTRAASLLGRALGQANIQTSGGGGGPSKTPISDDITELMIGPRPLSIQPATP